MSYCHRLFDILKTENQIFICRSDSFFPLTLQSNTHERLRDTTAGAKRKFVDDTDIRASNGSGTPVRMGYTKRMITFFCLVVADTYLVNGFTTSTTSRKTTSLHAQPNPYPHPMHYVSCLPYRPTLR